MARPQAENGHIDIAHKVAEALSRINLSAYESRVLWFVFRKTYGWHKKSDYISYTQFELGTELDRRHISRTIKRLEMRRILIVSSDPHGNEYAFQKDYEQWRSLPKEAIGSGKKLLPIQGGALPKEATKPLPKEANTKENKETIQKKRTPRSKTAGDPRIKDIFKIIEAKVGQQIPFYAKEGAAVQRALAMDYTPAQFTACWEAMKLIPFWQGKWLPLAKVTEYLGEFVKGGLESEQGLRDGAGREPQRRRSIKYIHGDAVQEGDEDMP